MPPKTVVITGASGRIGTILRNRLPRSLQVIGLDRKPSSGVRRVDSRDLRRLERAFIGADAVIDLATVNVAASWDDVLQNNLVGTQNTFEAARLAGVRRVVFASSVQVTAGYEDEEPYSSVVAGRLSELTPGKLERLGVDAAPRPTSPYGVGKVCGEAVGRYYAETAGMAVICLRFGHVNRTSRPESPRDFATLLTHDDLVQLVERALDAPDEIGFAALYGTSANRWGLWDLEPTRRIIGYEPRDNAEKWRTSG